MNCLEQNYTVELIYNIGFIPTSDFVDNAMLIVILDTLFLKVLILVVDFKVFYLICSSS